MTRAVVLLGGGRAVSGQVAKLLADGAAVVLAEAPEVLAEVVRAVGDGSDRRRFAAVAGDPSRADVRAAALEMAGEIHGADTPEVVEFGSGLDPPVK